ncbi:MAG: SRPBCC family protein [Acidobacteriota bacterium]
MKTFTLERSSFLPHPIDQVFGFFAQAQNLESLTPPLLRFQILTPLPIDMHQGTLIDYRLRVHGIPLRWRSEITAWDPPHRFIDEQLRGPYRRWVHEHRFTEVDGGTQVVDHVQYAVLGGSLIRRLFVAPDLQRIFDYRQERLPGLFDAWLASGGSA